MYTYNQASQHSNLVVGFIFLPVKPRSYWQLKAAEGKNISFMCMYGSQEADNVPAKGPHPWVDGLHKYTEWLIFKKKEKKKDWH